MQAGTQHNMEVLTVTLGISNTQTASGKLEKNVFVQMQINVTVPQKNEYCQPQECKSLHLKVFVL